MQPTAAQSSATKPGDTGNSESTSIQSSLPPSTSKPVKALLVLGLRAEANELVHLSISEELSGLDIQSVDADAAAAPDFEWPAVDVLLAAGTNGCQASLESATDQRIFCTLLTEESFRALATTKPEHTRLSALVIDQPISRQARVASSVYPSLSRYSVFSSSGTWVDERYPQNALDYFPYNSSTSLSRQLSEALSFHDALIATSDSSVFNSSTLSTILLTAYGYRKPVIGFSRAYVKAGALITSYSTPAQILREVAQRLTSMAHFDSNDATVSYPRYFSVIDNPSVAKSLGLIRERTITAGQTLTDEDFEP